MSRPAGWLAGVVAGALMSLSMPAHSLRIVTLSPHAAEMVAAAGAADQLVGVAAFTVVPPGATGLPVVGDARGLDRERIIALRPALAVAWRGGNRQPDLDWLAAQGIRVCESGPKTPGDIPREIRALAQLTGTADAGDAVARRLERQLARLHDDYARATPVRYFFQLWTSPPMTFGGNALISLALGECGGLNVFAEVPRESFTPDPETLHRVTPAVEIVPTAHSGSAPLTSAPRTVRIPTDALYRPGPAFIDAIAALCRQLRPPESP